MECITNNITTLDYFERVGNFEREVIAKERGKEEEMRCSREREGITDEKEMKEKK